jgi:hypothetical protein
MDLATERRIVGIDAPTPEPPEPPPEPAPLPAPPERLADDSYNHWTLMCVLARVLRDSGAETVAIDAVRTQYDRHVAKRFGFPANAQRTRDSFQRAYLAAVARGKVLFEERDGLTVLACRAKARMATGPL